MHSLYIQCLTFTHPFIPLGLQTPLNYNLASEYFPDLGFYVAADAAMRLDRQLPSACLMTFSPPGSFYLVRGKWGEGRGEGKGGEGRMKGDGNSLH